jgi:hypothetical protein
MTEGEEGCGSEDGNREDEDFSGGSHFLAASEISSADTLGRTAILERNGSLERRFFRF